MRVEKMVVKTLAIAGFFGSVTLMSAQTATSPAKEQSEKMTQVTQQQTNPEIEALKKANIPFYEYKDVFDNNRMYFRMYDEKFDNCHWNGNALMIAYTFMAEILSKDNSIFK